MKQSQIESFLWGVADLIRDTFSRCVYEYRPPRPLEEIVAELQAIEKDIVSMSREVAV